MNSLHNLGDTAVWINGHGAVYGLMAIILTAKARHHLRARRAWEAAECAVFAAFHIFLALFPD